jgi:hypothetical protein|tara:strand:- start:3701 stop:4018 length:318 start_codon:yes stop_codon:yes gene_type:complete
MWWDVIKNNEASEALLVILKESLVTTIPYHIETMARMNKALGVPVNYKEIRDAFAKTWNNAKEVVSLDEGFSRRFIGDGYSLNEVNWNYITKEIMKMYDNIIDNM